MTDFVTVEGRTLAQAMKFACAIIERRNTIPILNCVKLAYSGRGLAISATNLDIEVRLTVDVIDGAGDWSICVPATTLKQIAQAAGVAPLRIEREEIEVKAGHKEATGYTRTDIKVTLGDVDAVYVIEHALPAEDWPAMEGERGELIERFTNGMLADTFSKVAWAISTEETRYYLNGIFWHLASSGRTFAATDGHRLAACRYSSDGSNQPGRIIPRKTVAVICQFLAGEDVEVFATEKETLIDIAWPGGRMRSKLIDGTFPDYTRVIPKSEAMNHRFEIRREEIVTAIRQAAAIGGGPTGRAIRFHPVAGKMHVEQKNIEIGAANIRTSIAWPAEAQPFCFNSRYMLDIAEKCQGEITIGMADHSSPFLISDGDNTMTRVIMPMSA